MKKHCLLITFLIIATFETVGQTVGKHNALLIANGSYRNFSSLATSVNKSNNLGKVLEELATNKFVGRMDLAMATEQTNIKKSAKNQSSTKSNPTYTQKYINHRAIYASTIEITIGLEGISTAMVALGAANLADSYTVGHEAVRTASIAVFSAGLGVGTVSTVVICVISYLWNREYAGLNISHATRSQRTIATLSRATPDGGYDITNHALALGMNVKL